MGGIPLPGAGAAAPAPLGGLAPPLGGCAAAPPPATRLLPPVLEGGRAAPPLPLVAGVGGDTGRGPLGRTGAAVDPPVPLTPDGGLGIADATGVELAAPL